MNIVTNNHRRTLVTFVDLTASEREEFDYIGEGAGEEEHYTPRFVRAYGNVYDTGDVQRINVAPRHEPFGFNVAADSPLASWNGIDSDSAFSATVFRVVTDEFDDTSVIVGRAYSA